MAVTVSITGTLSIPRKEAAALIESKTNARFSPAVTYDTNYLVAARFDTTKARKAAMLGVTIISETDMMGYISAGQFPETKLPNRPKHPANFPDIKWVEFFDPEAIISIEYQDASGVVTTRYMLLTCRGESGGNEYIGGYDAERFKTFRIDRLLKWEVIALQTNS